MAEQLGYTLTIRTRREGNGAQQAAADVRAFNEELERTQRTQTRTAAATNRSAQGTRNFGLATLEASRALEDAQYGMRGVLNNIPTLLMMLGAGPGLAGVVSVAAVTLSLLTKELERQKQAAKESAMAADEAGDSLARAYSDEQIDRVKELANEMQVLAAMEEQLAQQGQRTADLDEHRRQNIEAVTKALREAAEVEIKLREARGEITGADAQAQLAMLEGEQRAAALESQLAVREKQVSDARRRHEAALREIAELERQRAESEQFLQQLQSDQAGINQEAQRLRTIREQGGGELPANMQRRLDDLEMQLAGIAEGIETNLEVIDSAPEEIARLSVAAGESAAALDDALARFESDQARLRDVYQIEERTAQLTSTSEQIAQAQSDQLSAAQAAVAAVESSGVELNDAQQAALDRSRQSLEDGRLTMQELAAFGEDFQTITSGWQGAIGDLNAITSQVMAATQTLAAEVARQKEHVRRLTSQINDLQSR